MGDSLILDRIQGVEASTALKAPCRVLATTNVAFVGSAPAGFLTIDGVTLSDNAGTGAAADRVLLTGQTDPTQNGIYVVQATNWYRALDFDGARDAVTGTMVFISAGLTNANTLWMLTSTNPVIFDTSDITFVQFTGLFTIPNTAAPSFLTSNGFVYDFFNPNWAAPSQLLSTSVNPHPFGCATLAITRQSAGSGTAGPPFTDCGLFVKSLKTGLLTDTTAIGEIDGVYVYTQQHGVGDTGGLLADVNIVGSTGGGAVGCEVSVSRLDTSGGKTLTAHGILGYIEEGNSTCISCDLEGWTGPVLGLRIGTLDLHAGTDGPAPTMLTAIQVRANRLDSETVYQLTGPDHSLPGFSRYGSPAEDMWNGYNLSTHTMQWLADGVTFVASLNPAGDFTNAGQVLAAKGVGAYGVTPPGSRPAITGALSTVSDAAAKAVLTSIIGIIVGAGFATNGTT